MVYIDDIQAFVLSHAVESSMLFRSSPTQFSVRNAYNETPPIAWGERGRSVPWVI
jgi:hypothetical protein